MLQSIEVIILNSGLVSGKVYDVTDFLDGT